jgi:hypothetical protein
MTNACSLNLGQALDPGSATETAPLCERAATVSGAPGMWSVANKLAKYLAFCVAYAY